MVISLPEIATAQGTSDEIILSGPAGTRSYQIERLYEDRVIAIDQQGNRVEFRTDEITQATNRSIESANREVELILNRIKREDFGELSEFVKQLDDLTLRIESLNLTYGWLVNNLNEVLQELVQQKNLLSDGLAIQNRIESRLREHQRKIDRGGAIPSNWNDELSSQIAKVERLPFPQIRQQLLEDIQRSVVEFQKKLESATNYQTKRISDLTAELKDQLDNKTLTHETWQTGLANLENAVGRLPIEENRNDFQNRLDSFKAEFEPAVAQLNREQTYQNIAKKLSELRHGLNNQNINLSEFDQFAQATRLTLDPYPSSASKEHLLAQIKSLEDLLGQQQLEQTTQTEHSSESPQATDDGKNPLSELSLPFALIVGVSLIVVFVVIFLVRRKKVKAQNRTAPAQPLNTVATNFSSTRNVAEREQLYSKTEGLQEKSESQPEPDKPISIWSSFNEEIKVSDQKETAVEAESPILEQGLELPSDVSPEPSDAVLEQQTPAESDELKDSGATVTPIDQTESVFSTDQDETIEETDSVEETTEESEDENTNQLAPASPDLSAWLESDKVDQDIDLAAITEGFSEGFDLDATIDEFSQSEADVTESREEPSSVDETVFEQETPSEFDLDQSDTESEEYSFDAQIEDSTLPEVDTETKADSTPQPVPTPPPPVENELVDASLGGGEDLAETEGGSANYAEFLDDLGNEPTVEPPTELNRTVADDYLLRPQLEEGLKFNLVNPLDLYVAQDYLILLATKAQKSLWIGILDRQEDGWGVSGTNYIDLPDTSGRIEMIGEQVLLLTEKAVYLSASPGALLDNQTIARIPLPFKLFGNRKDLAASLDWSAKGNNLFISNKISDVAMMQIVPESQNHLHLSWETKLPTPPPHSNLIVFENHVGVLSQDLDLSLLSTKHGKICHHQAYGPSIDETTAYKLSSDVIRYRDQLFFIASSSGSEAGVFALDLTQQKIQYIHKLNSSLGLALHGTDDGLVVVTGEVVQFLEISNSHLRCEYPLGPLLVKQNIQDKAAILLLTHSPENHKEKLVRLGRNSGIMLHENTSLSAGVKSINDTELVNGEVLLWGLEESGDGVLRLFS